MEYSKGKERLTETPLQTLEGISEPSKQRRQSAFIGGDGDGFADKTDSLLDCGARSNTRQHEGSPRPSSAQAIPHRTKKGENNLEQENVRLRRSPRNHQKTKLQVGMADTFSPDSAETSHGKQQPGRNPNYEKPTLTSEVAQSYQNRLNIDRNAMAGGSILYKLKDVTLYHEPISTAALKKEVEAGLPEVIGEIQPIDDDSTDEDFSSAEEDEHHAPEDSFRVIVWDKSKIIVLAIFVTLRLMYEVWWGDIKLSISADDSGIDTDAN